MTGQAIHVGDYVRILSGAHEGSVARVDELVGRHARVFVPDISQWTGWVNRAEIEAVDR